MKRRYKNSGFTMAEMLIVVAIIAVLSGVGFVAVQNHQRGMTMLDRDAVAKEIFVAAQNHLTMAESQNYWGVDMEVSPTTIGIEDNSDESKTIPKVYLSQFNGTSNDVMEILLPFGSIDETVRSGGRYFILYQTHPARILDVFYWTTDKKYGSTTVTEGDYQTFFNNKNDREWRKNNKPVVGWFGGEEPLLAGDYTIVAPKIEVENADRLVVKITDTNAIDATNQIKLKLIVTNIKEDHKVSFDLAEPSEAHPRVTKDSNDYYVVLDDITDKGAEDYRFMALNGIGTEPRADETEGAFFPGEDIVVQAVAYSNSKLSNIAYSNKITTNSLFAEIEDIKEASNDVDKNETEPLEGKFANGLTAKEMGIKPLFAAGETSGQKKKAKIASIRHLENLDKEISSLSADVNVAQAEQVKDLIWYEEDKDCFISNILKDVRYINKNIEAVQVKYGDGMKTDGGYYKPVNVSYLESYSGKVQTEDESEIKNHSITGIKAKITGNAGLFGEFGKASVSEDETISISNLTLIDFDIQATGNAGALAGTLTNTTVSDVLAYHNKGFIVNENEYRNITSTGDDGDAGGLVGSMTGGKIEYSAASLYVSAIKNTGGLIGTANGTEEVSYCYSGGHTLSGSYGTSTENTVKGHINVLGGQNVGGLIGEASGKMTVKYCYSTCSVKGSTAGGFIGKATDSDPDSVVVMQNYAGGLVLTINTEGKRGTFLGDGSLKQGADSDTPTNYYVSGINGTLGSGAVDIAGPFEIPDSSTAEHPFNYDDEWDEIDKSYPFKTMEEWAGDTLERKPEFLKIHYGDWSEPKPMGTNLVLTNAEKLTAKVSMPVPELGEGQMLTMLIKGEKSEKTAYLLLALDKKTEGDKTTYSVIPTEKTAIAGIESAKISEWLEKIVVTPDNVSETGSFFEMTLTLDSITDQGGHFAEIFPEFIPGENIVVAAKGHEVSPDKMKEIFTDAENKIKDMPVKADDTHVLADMTNSLFASINDSATTASIENIRHLENLDKAISRLGQNSTDDKKVTISTAVQISNMNWKKDWSEGWTTATVYKYGETTERPDDKGLFIPVTPDYVLEYKGEGKTISGITVNSAGNAGLFGALSGSDEKASSVSNLMLSDFDIKSSGTGENGNAGALAGVLTKTTVKDVVIGSGTLENVTTTALKVETATGNAGGLVGSMSGGSATNVHIFSDNATVKAITSGNAGGMIGKSDSGSVTNALVHGSGETVTTNAGDAGGLIGSMSGGAVEKSAAAVIVSGKDAGGLIGAASGDATVSASYSGGHTNNGTYYNGVNPIYNVTGTANAGGLIGNAGDTAITNSYSTCSAKGDTVGGFVGRASGNITNCYATGLVGGAADTSTKGAFAGSLTNATNCWYYEIINEGMPALPGGSTVVFNEIDKDIDSYNSFVNAPATWNQAESYDSTLGTYFENKFNLRTVDQLTDIGEKGLATGTEFVVKHYGDWPAPEQLVINE